jgi:hypothetical protein
VVKYDSTQVDYAIHNLVLEYAMAEDPKDAPQPPTPSGAEEGRRAVQEYIDDLRRAN